MAGANESLTLRVPVSVPETVGWNLTYIVHEDASASDAGQLLSEMAKFAVMLIEGNVMAAPLLLVTVTIFDELAVPTAVEA